GAARGFLPGPSCLLEGVGERPGELPADHGMEAQVAKFPTTRAVSPVGRPPATSRTAPGCIASFRLATIPGAGTDGGKGADRDAEGASTGPLASGPGAGDRRRHPPLGGRGGWRTEPPGDAGGPAAARSAGRGRSRRARVPPRAGRARPVLPP